MAEEMKRLRKALDEFRSGRTRARADQLRNAGLEMQEALPSAFDPENEKKNIVEEEAHNLYAECEEALQRASPVQTSPKKRHRDQVSSAAK